MKHLAIFLFIMAVTLLVIGFLPDPIETSHFQYTGKAIIDQLGVNNADEVLSDNERTYLQNVTLDIDLKIPKSVLLGRKGHITLGYAIQPTSLRTESVIDSGKINMQIKAKPNLPRLFIEPFGTVIYAISPKNTRAIHWNILAIKQAPISGNLWVYLTILPPSGETIEATILNREMAVPVRSILGMDLKTSRTISLITILFVLAILLFNKLGLKKLFDKN
jgi:hypothetical protein